jgi:hypothetical protein
VGATDGVAVGMAEGVSVGTSNAPIFIPTVPEQLPFT